MRRTVGIAATAATAAIATTLMAPQAEAQSDGDTPMASILAVEIATMRQEYEARIRALEEQLEALQSGRAGKAADPHDHGAHDDHDDHGHDDAMTGHDDHGDAFTPQIGAVLRGMFASRSAEGSHIARGFELGHESEPAPEGFSLGHSELSLSSDVSNALRGAVVVGVGVHGQETEIELEEAYIQTLPGSGLPREVTLTAGRKLWSFGYLNERHAHEDDFADRPLAYRAFLDGAYNDDGIQVSFALPGAMRTEIGGGLFRGDDQPFGVSDNGRRALSAFARVGGDVGRDASWGIGVSLLSGRVDDSGGGHAHDHGDDEHEDEHGHDEHDHDDHDEHAHEDDHDDHDHDEDEHHEDEHEDHDHEEHEHEHEEHEHEEHDEHDHDEAFEPFSPDSPLQR